MTLYDYYVLDFWLRQGAQGVTMSVCPSVRPAQYAQYQSRGVNIHHSGSNLQAISQE